MGQPQNRDNHQAARLISGPSNPRGIHPPHPRFPRFNSGYFRKRARKQRTVLSIAASVRKSFAVFLSFCLNLIRQIRAIRGSPAFCIFRVTDRQILRSTLVNGQK
jgi:hypothetical protein